MSVDDRPRQTELCRQLLIDPKLLTVARTDAHLRACLVAYIRGECSLVEALTVFALNAHETVEATRLWAIQQAARSEVFINPVFTTQTYTPVHLDDSPSVIVERKAATSSRLRLWAGGKWPALHTCLGAYEQSKCGLGVALAVLIFNRRKTIDRWRWEMSRDALRRFVATVVKKGAT